jgi:Uma2 family endonuclease
VWFLSGEYIEEWSSNMQAQAKVRLTPEEYLAIERAAEYKSEYYNGEMFAMAGASRWHTLIVGNLIGALHSQLRGKGCRIHPTDLRVKVPSTGLYTYPDVVVTCGQELFEDEEFDILLNPLLIIEVLSKSTAAYDRGEKFVLYRGSESLREYILVSQDRMLIEQFVRQEDDSWLLRTASTISGMVNLVSCDCTLHLADVYENVEFPDVTPLRSEA